MFKKISFFTTCLALCFFLISCRSALPQTQHSETVPKLNLSQQTPLIFLHGSGGSETDLIPFAEDFLSSSPEPVEILKVQISATNKITYLNNLLEPDSLPLIFVGFANNFADIEDWSQGLAVLLRDLQETYHLNSANLIGFSNGGLAVTHYTELFGTKEGYPEIKKLVTIGAPYNDLEPLNDGTTLNFSDKSKASEYLDIFLKPKNQLPPSLQVLAIAGDTGQNSDDIVPVSSALASRLIFPGEVAYYQERLALGPKASHGGLITNNPDVNKWVSNFLFKLALDKTGNYFLAEN